MKIVKNQLADLPISNTLDLNNIIGDDAWVEVVQQMDAIYTDLVHSQVELEGKNAELEEAHQFIESILSAMHNILIVTDTKGYIQRINSALEALIGKASIELQGQSLSTLFSKSEASTQKTKKLTKKFNWVTCLIVKLI
jgi:two-component system sensor histidine kinase HupT/HoxJ